MKTLLIFRHAKSSWDDPNLPDQERPLSPRGRKDAPRVGKLLHKQELLPDLVLCSSALRTRQTAELALKEAGYTREVRVVDELYAAAPEAILEALATLPDAVQRVMVIGHNPGLEELLFYLTGERQPLPTAALAQIDLPIQSWSEMRAAPKGVLVGIWRPKEL